MFYWSYRWYAKLGRFLSTLVCQSCSRYWLLFVPNFRLWADYQVLETPMNWPHGGLRYGMSMGQLAMVNSNHLACHSVSLLVMGRVSTGVKRVLHTQFMRVGVPNRPGKYLSGKGSSLILLHFLVQYVLLVL